MNGTQQNRVALLKAQGRRTERRQLHDDFRDGKVDLADILLDPPEMLLKVPIIDVLRLIRNPKNHAPVWFVRMGRDAAASDINLLLPLGRASVHTRTWVVKYAQLHLRASHCSAAAQGVAA